MSHNSYISAKLNLATELTNKFFKLKRFNNVFLANKITN